MRQLCLTYMGHDCLNTSICLAVARIGMCFAAVLFSWHRQSHTVVLFAVEILQIKVRITQGGQIMVSQEQAAIVCKIRPISWKICVQGDKETEYVRQVLEASGAVRTPTAREPDLLDPPVFSFVMTPKAMTPLTAPELQSLFNQDPKIKLAWEVAEQCRPSEYSVIS